MVGIAKGGDGLSPIRYAWVAAEVVLIAGAVGSLVLGQSFLLAIVALGILAPMDLMHRRWMVNEFERVIRRPTWIAASAGAIGEAHHGQLAVFEAEGRLTKGFTARPWATVVGFDDVAFVALSHAAMLSRVRRTVILKHDVSRFAVQQDGGECLLVQRDGGLRLRILAGGGVGRVALEHFGLDPGNPKAAPDLARALDACGWT